MHPLGPDIPRCTFYFPAGELPSVQPVRIADYGSEGRFQLMREIRHKILLFSCVSSQILNISFHSVRHTVEAVRQFAQLVPAFDMNTFRVRAACDPVRRPRHLLNRICQ